MDDLLELYDTEVRANLKYPDILQLVRSENFLKIVGNYDFVSYWDIPRDDAPRIVQEQVDYYRSEKRPLIWRVFDHDRPENLEAVLKQKGFTYGDSVTLVVLPLNEAEVESSGHDIRELKEPAEITDFMSVTEAAFGEPSPNDYEHFCSLLPVPNFRFYVGYNNNIPVAAARFIVPEETRFGLLFGGCVLPSSRGKGFYRDLVNTRIKEAKALGLEYLTTEARETSRPILEKLGFRPLAKGRTWNFFPDARD